MAGKDKLDVTDGRRPRPFLDFLVQGSIALVLLVVIVQATYRLSGLLGTLVPFAWEKQVSALALKDFPLTDSGPEAQARRAVLQKLVDQLASHEDLPDGMAITIHYSAQPVVNAFATLGGNIVVYEGLIARLPSENALSMVLSHEMSHVKQRDAIRGIGAEQLVTLIGGLATGDSNLAGQIVSNIQLLTSLEFSREVEERADREGLAALYGHYRHVNGYTQTFDALEDWIHDNGGDGAQPPEFLRDHPDTAARKLKLAALAERNKWPTSGALTTLRQANFLPRQKFGPWGAPAPVDNSPSTKATPNSTNYQPGSPMSQTESAPAEPPAGTPGHALADLPEAKIPQLLLEDEAPALSAEPDVQLPEVEIDASTVKPPAFEVTPSPKPQH